MASRSESAMLPSGSAHCYRYAFRVAAHSFVAQVDLIVLVNECLDALIEQRLSKEDQLLISGLERKLLVNRRPERSLRASPGSSSNAFKLNERSAVPRAGSVKRAI